MCILFFFFIVPFLLWVNLYCVVVFFDFVVCLPSSSNSDNTFCFFVVCGYSRRLLAIKLKFAPRHTSSSPPSIPAPTQHELASQPHPFTLPTTHQVENPEASESDHASTSPHYVSESSQYATTRQSHHLEQTTLPEQSLPTPTLTYPSVPAPTSPLPRRLTLVEIDELSGAALVDSDAASSLPSPLPSTQAPPTTTPMIPAIMAPLWRPSTAPPAGIGVFFLKKTCPPH